MFERATYWLSYYATEKSFWTDRWILLKTCLQSWQGWKPHLCKAVVNCFMFRHDPLKLPRDTLQVIAMSPPYSPELQLNCFANGKTNRTILFFSVFDWGACRVPDLWSESHGMESWLEQQIFLPWGQLSVLTHTSVFGPPLRYHSSM